MSSNKVVSADAKFECKTEDSLEYYKNGTLYKTIRNDPTAALRNIKTPTNMWDYIKAFILEHNDKYLLDIKSYNVDLSQLTQEEINRIKEVMEMCFKNYYDKSGGCGTVYFTRIIYTKMFEQQKTD
ncbi:hypothetical protein [Mythimna sequax nucleopolyhedrovirus]|nr:hypothetical protein [Mythimna sequax nucleopolyhedrovirus]